MGASRPSLPSVTRSTAHARRHVDDPRQHDRFDHRAQNPRRRTRWHANLRRPRLLPAPAPPEDMGPTRNSRNRKQNGPDNIKGKLKRTTKPGTATSDGTTPTPDLSFRTLLALPSWQPKTRWHADLRFTE